MRPSLMHEGWHDLRIDSVRQFYRERLTLHAGATRAAEVFFVAEMTVERSTHFKAGEQVSWCLVLRLPSARPSLEAFVRASASEAVADLATVALHRQEHLDRGWLGNVAEIGDSEVCVGSRVWCDAYKLPSRRNPYFLVTACDWRKVSL